MGNSETFLLCASGYSNCKPQENAGRYLHKLRSARETAVHSRTIYTRGHGKENLHSALIEEYTFFTRV